jgi:hypothetical protein
VTAPAIGRRTQTQRRPGAGRRLATPLTGRINVSGAQAVTLARDGVRARYRRGITSRHHGDRQTVLEAVTQRLQDAFLPTDPGGRESRAWLLASSGAYVMLTRSHPRLARIASHAVEASAPNLNYGRRSRHTAGTSGWPSLTPSRRRQLPPQRPRSGPRPRGHHRTRINSNKTNGGGVNIRPPQSDQYWGFWHTFRGALDGLVGEEYAAAEQVGFGASVHLSFEHLDAVDVAFDGT